MMITLAAESAFALELEVRLRLARQDDLPKLEWFGQYTHYRRIFLRTFAEQQRDYIVHLRDDPWSTDVVGRVHEVTDTPLPNPGAFPPPLNWKYQ